MSKEKNIKPKKRGTRLKVPKTVQQSIPYESIYPNGVIEVKPGCFSKSYYFGDANFRGEDEKKQESMFLDYGTLLNKFPHNITTQVTIFNRSIDIDEAKNNILIKPRRDGLHLYRDDMNNILLAKMSEGRNNLKKERYFTVTIENTDIESAASSFRTLDMEINEGFQAINKSGARPLSLKERLEILYEIYNPESALSFNQKMADYIGIGDYFDLRKLNQNGITTKDVIGPESITVKADYIKLGDVYARALFLDSLPTFLNTNILGDLTDLPCNMLCSIIYRTLPQKKALKDIRMQVTNINGEVVKAEKIASRGGYSPDLISPELKRSRQEAEALLSDVVSRNQKVFFSTITMVLFAKDLDELNTRTNQLCTKASDFMCQAKKLIAQQMPGFNSAIPLASLGIGIDRILTTESASVFIPFSMQEITDNKGHYYALNAISRNMVIYDRANSKLPNGIILGQSGSGKSMQAKQEISQTLLKTDDDIIVIDPQGEYSEPAKKLGGQVVKIVNGTYTHINPLDMDLDYSDDGDPVAMKCDYLTAICETIVGKNIGLTPYDINIIHRCGRAIYEPYIKHMETKKKEGITCDRAASPTLIDFFEKLQQQPEGDARRLALCLEQYCTGNYDIFAYRTNIDVTSRFMVYDIKDIGSGNKELAMQVCLNDIWNRIIANFKKGKRTWIYLDEFYLLTQTPSSATLLQKYYKQSRKWAGIMTGITQDVEDLLVTPEARGIFNNCGFVIMMNQSNIGRGELASLFNISSNMLTYISDKPPGTGLLYNGYSIIPMENKWPKESKLFQLLTTKPEDTFDNGGVA